MCINKYIMSSEIWVHMQPLMQSEWPLLIISKRKDLHALNTSVYICCAHVISNFIWGWVLGICNQWNTILLVMCLEKFTYEMIGSNYPMPQLLHSE